MCHIHILMHSLFKVISMQDQKYLTHSKLVHFNFTQVLGLIHLITFEYT